MDDNDRNSRRIAPDLGISAIGTWTEKTGWREVWVSSDEQRRRTGVYQQIIDGIISEAAAG